MDHLDDTAHVHLSDPAVMKPTVKMTSIPNQSNTGPFEGKNLVDLMGHIGKVAHIDLTSPINLVDHIEQDDHIAHIDQW